jgi:glycosyltransferase involved in cell wall biosynthesis
LKVLVCLPSYNEEDNVEMMIKKLQSTGLDFVLCDGHSTDKTVEIATNLGAKILNRKGFGKGSAITTTIEYASKNGYDVMATIDCDQTYRVEDIPMLISYMPEYDMVVGARNLKDITFIRRMANVVMNASTNILFASKVLDMATGLRAFKVDLFLPYLNAESFDIEPQIYGVALRRKYKIKQVRVEYDRRVGDSKIKGWHLILIIWRLVRERFNTSK